MNVGQDHSRTYMTVALFAALASRARRPSMRSALSLGPIFVLGFSSSCRDDTAVCRPRFFACYICEIRHFAVTSDRYARFWF